MAVLTFCAIGICLTLVVPEESKVVDLVYGGF
jgi:hypothetical protein